MDQKLTAQLFRVALLDSPNRRLLHEGYHCYHLPGRIPTNLQLEHLRQRIVLPTPQKLFGWFCRGIVPNAEIEIAARVSILRELGLTLQTVTIGGDALIPMRWGNFDYGTEGYENSKRHPGVVDTRQAKILTAKKVGVNYIVESWYDCMFVITEAGVDLGGGLGCSRHTDFGAGPAWTRNFYVGQELRRDSFRSIERDLGIFIR